MFKLEMVDDRTLQVVEYYDDIKTAEELRYRLDYAAMEAVVFKVYGKNSQNNWAPMTMKDLYKVLLEV